MNEHESSLRLADRLGFLLARYWLRGGRRRELDGKDAGQAQPDRHAARGAKKSA